MAEENLAIQRDPEYGKPGSQLKEPPVLGLRFTRWYYAALALPVAALIAAGVDRRLNREVLIDHYAGPLGDDALGDDRT